MRRSQETGFVGRLVLGREDALRGNTGSIADIAGVLRQSATPSPLFEPFALFCGEGCNRAELAVRHGLPPSADWKQVLLTGWRSEGERFFAHVDGAFALALWDGHEVVLYRDPSGLVALYTHTAGDGSLAFATEMDALEAALDSSPSLARAALHEYLRFGDISAPRTIVTGVAALEPGQCWRIGPETSRAGMAAAPIPPHRRSGLDDVLDALVKHLRAAVERRLEGATRPAVFLSGGIDSALLCAIAAESHPDITAVTVGFADTPHDEAPVAQAIAQRLRVRHEVLHFTQAEQFEAFERLARKLDQPMADPATVPTLLAMENCRERFDAVLDGTGADESVGLMPPRHIRLAVRYVARLPPNLRSWLTRNLARHPVLARYTAMTRFEHPAELMIRWKGFTRQEIEQLTGEAVSFEQTHFYRTFDRVHRQSPLDWGTALLNAMPCDRVSQAMRASGADVRFPFCDPVVDGFLRSLPADLRHGRGQPKTVLRELLARYLPRTLWDLPKHGFDFPLAQFLESDDYRVPRRYLESRFWAENGSLVAERADTYLRDFIAGDRSCTFRVWLLVTLAAWLETHEILGR